jgi:hypothetical protein
LLEEVPKEGEQMKMLGSAMVASASSKEELLEILKNDIYAKSEVWDFDKVSIYEVLEGRQDVLLTGCRSRFIRSSVHSGFHIHEVKDVEGKMEERFTCENEMRLGVRKSQLHEVCRHGFFHAINSTSKKFKPNSCRVVETRDPTHEFTCKTDNAYPFPHPSFVNCSPRPFSFLLKPNRTT